MMDIRAAVPDDYESVRSFYHELIDTSPYTPMWEKDVFPDNDDLCEAVEGGNLFMGVIDGRTAACVVSCCSEDTATLNLLGVLPSFTGRGLAKQMISFVTDRARSCGCRSLKLDVLEGNTAAEGLYLSMGFSLVGSFEEYYERTGKLVFRVYEYVL